MTALNKQALREMAERAGSDSWGYDRDEFNDAITPEVVLALLDELEAAENRIAELEAREVMLPTPYPKGYGLAADKYNFALEECADAIRAAGIGVKGE